MSGAAGPSAALDATEASPARIVVAGEALMDVFAAGATDDGLRLDARVGGSPFNVAVALARLGQPVAFLGALSTDLFGERLLRRLRVEGVGTDLVQRCDAPTTLSVVTVDRRGQPRYAFHRQDTADARLAEVPLPAGAEVLQVGSYGLVVAPAAAALQAMVRDAHRCGRLVAWDLNVRLNVEPRRALWRDAVHQLLPWVHLFKFSEEDAAALDPGATLEDLAAQALARGVSAVVATRGARGAAVWTQQVCTGVPAEPVMLVDTLGAGDAFQAGLLAWLGERGALSPGALAGLDAQGWRDALGWASAVAAINCARRGADAPRRAEMDHRRTVG